MVLFFPVPCFLLCLLNYFLFLSTSMVFISWFSHVLIYQVSTLVSTIYLLMLSSFPPEHSPVTKHFTAMDVNSLNSEDYCSKTDPSLSCECAVFALSEMETNEITFKQLFFKDVSVSLFSFVFHSSLDQWLHTARISLHFYCVPFLYIE